MLAEHLDTGALLLGLVGSVLWAQNGRFVKYVSLFWMVSSVLWIMYASAAHLPAVALNHVANLCLNLYGCKRWLGTGKPREKKPAMPTAPQQNGSTNAAT